MTKLAVALTPYSKARHLVIVGARHQRHRSLCGYKVLSRPAGEASMKDWNASYCQECASLAHTLTAAP